MAERKKYIEVSIPSIETSFRILGTLESLHKKTIKLDMSRKLRGKGLMATFRIFKHKKELIAITEKLELTKSYIRKMMRKRADYVEDSFKTKCLDIRAIIKPFLITRKRVSRVVRKNLRNTAREFIVDHLKEKNYSEISNEIFTGTLQKAMLPKLKKIYPLSFCEIRVLETKEIEKINLETIMEQNKKKKSPQEEAPKEIKEIKKEDRKNPIS